MSKKMNDQETRFIENSLQLSNRLIAQELDKTEAQIRNYLHRQGIRRTKEELDQIRERIAANRTGENNPNWRGGISRDNYHYKKIQIERYPDRVRARQRIYYHKKVKNLIPGSCKICGTKEGIEAHHPDYSQPLKVEWLCSKCHRELHQSFREQGSNEFKNRFKLNDRTT